MWGEIRNGTYGRLCFDVCTFVCILKSLYEDKVCKTKNNISLDVNMTFKFAYMYVVLFVIQFDYFVGYDFNNNLIIFKVNILYYKAVYETVKEGVSELVKIFLRVYRSRSKVDMKKFFSRTVG